VVLVVVEEEDSATAMDAVACLEAAGGDSAMAKVAWAVTSRRWAVVPPGRTTLLLDLAAAIRRAAGSADSCPAASAARATVEAGAAGAVGSCPTAAAASKQGMDPTDSHQNSQIKDCSLCTLSWQ